MDNLGYINVTDTHISVFNDNPNLSDVFQIINTEIGEDGSVKMLMKSEFFDDVGDDDIPTYSLKITTQESGVSYSVERLSPPMLNG